MRMRVIPRALAAVTSAALLSAALLSGCGGDEASSADCGDPERSVEDGSLQFNDACCSDAECATGSCGSFNNKGDRCSQACSTDADCAGLGDEKCGGQGLCAVPG